MVRAPMVSGLRTKYFPKSRIGHGLISLAPWFDVLMVFGLFLLLEGKYTLSPGVVVDLPTSAVRAGLRSDLSAVVFTVERARDGAREEVLMFDDALYHLEDTKDMNRLAEAVRTAAEAYDAPALILFADAAVSHGSVVELSNLIRACGITRLNLATRGQDAGPGW